MNLSPAWVGILGAEGWETVHWHEVGEPNAPDAEIMGWARDCGYYVVTNDLDFSAILAATRAEGPSVVQIRAQDLAPDTLAPTLVTVLRQYAASLASGAILPLDARVMLAAFFGFRVYGIEKPGKTGRKSGTYHVETGLRGAGQRSVQRKTWSVPVFRPASREHSTKINRSPFPGCCQCVSLKIDKVLGTAVTRRSCRDPSNDQRPRGCAPDLLRRTAEHRHADIGLPNPASSPPPGPGPLPTVRTAPRSRA